MVVALLNSCGDKEESNQLSSCISLCMAKSPQRKKVIIIFGRSSDHTTTCEPAIGNIGTIRYDTINWAVSLVIPSPGRGNQRELDIEIVKPH